MARYDDNAAIKESVALNTQVINSDTTTVGNIIDLQGFNSLTFTMQAGVVSAGDVTALIEDGNDPALADAAPVSDTFLSGTEADTKLDASNTVSKIGYVGKKRFVRLSAVTDNSANLTVGATALVSKGNVPAT